ncbi:MAG: succinylglutamate desuccinylase/aspartoacylase family protein [Bacteroidales bacterium]|nr:MAG: succinylglutamate desuccinylase/aspartoacylase family protein [Bacteroidales bacterium]
MRYPDIIRKSIISLFGFVIFIFSGIGFYQHRHLKEPVVIDPVTTRLRNLGDYFGGVKGTMNDCNIYILEGKEPGGTMMILGGSHPEEPAGRLAAWIIVENASIRKGRLIIVLSANRSGTTVTRPGGAYPPDYTIPTGWGIQKFRMGDRWSNPLDQWPDPEVYIHYPSGQNLAYVDIRNLNRTWPGRPNGTLTEKTCHAFMNLITEEKVDIVIDLHEAELQYPVINTIVAHDDGLELATLVSMMLSDLEGFNMGTEFSPKNLHGLSHREIGDHSDAISLLFESPEPFLDATRGITSRELLLEGKDEFVVKAGEHGLLFAPIDEKGWPVKIRVGRHTSAILQTMEIWNEYYPDKEILFDNIPRYTELIKNGVGFYLKDPSETGSDQIIYE